MCRPATIELNTSNHSVILSAPLAPLSTRDAFYRRNLPGSSALSARPLRRARRSSRRRPATSRRQSRSPSKTAQAARATLIDVNDDELSPRSTRTSTGGRATGATGGPVKDRTPWLQLTGTPASGLLGMLLIPTPLGAPVAWGLPLSLGDSTSEADPRRRMPHEEAHTRGALNTAKPTSSWRRP